MVSSMVGGMGTEIIAVADVLVDERGLYAARLHGDPAFS